MQQKQIFLKNHNFCHYSLENALKRLKKIYFLCYNSVTENLERTLWPVRAVKSDVLITRAEKAALGILE